MVRRKPPLAPWVQLSIGESPANDTLDDVLGPAHVVGGADAPGPRAPRRGRDRVAAGRHAKRVGDALEAWVRAQLSAAQLAGVITWFAKIEAGARYTPRRNPATGAWSQELTWAERAAADFIAVRAADGLSVALECKSVEGTRLSRAAIEPQQVEHLDATHRAGGVALLVVEYRAEGALVTTTRQYCVPWSEVPWEVERTAWSVPEKPLARWRVRAAEIFDRLRGR